MRLGILALGLILFVQPVAAEADYAGREATTSA